MFNAIKKIKSWQLVGDLRKRFALTEVLYFLTGVLIISALFVHFYHPAQIVDLVISTEKLQFRLDTSAEEQELLRSVPISFLGIGGFEKFQVPMVEAFWPGSCQTSTEQDNLQAMEAGTLLITPKPDQESQLLFVCSRKLQITDLNANGGDEILLWPRSVESQHQINLEIHQGQPRLRIQMLSDTINVRSQDCHIKAQQAGRLLDLSSDSNGFIGFRPIPDEREASFVCSGPRFLIFYDIRDLNPENDDLLRVPFRVENIDFNDTKIPFDNPGSKVAAECVAMSRGDETIMAWSGRVIYIQKHDLDHFELRQVRARQPGRLQVALRGDTGTFRAGLSEPLENQIPSALSSLYARLGLLIGLLLWILNLFLKLKGGRKDV